MWHDLGSPEPFRIVEVGAGDGTLATQILEALQDVPLEYTAIERSAGAREKLAELPIRVAPSLEVIEQELTGCLIANELLDNLPFRRVRRSRNRLVEVLVGVKRGRFVEVEERCGEDLCGELPELDLAPGEERQVSLEALRFVERVAMVLRRGFALLIDYALPSGTHVHGYRKHRVVMDVLERPGSTDITAGVDLAPIAARAEELALEVLGPLSQRACLTALGLDRYMEEERARQVRFLQEGAGREAVRVFSGRTRALTLVDPEQLGQLQWLLLATQGCDWPAWAKQAVGA
jgi:SAM-dependent MidA family methyltransferase